MWKWILIWKRLRQREHLMQSDRMSNARGKEGDASSGGSGQRRRSRSTWLRIAIVFGAIAAVLALLVFVLPTPLARWALSRQLEQMGISAEGLKTLDVDLAQGEVWLGPVQFASSGREPAQIVEFGFDASLSSLLERRVLFDRMIIRGLDVHVRRVLNGPMTINGIEVAQFLPKSTPEAAQTEAAQPEPGRQPQKEQPADGTWAAGIDDFEFRDSRLLLTSADGGRLVIERRAAGAARLSHVDGGSARHVHPGRRCERHQVHGRR